MSSTFFLSGILLVGELDRNSFAIQITLCSSWLLFVFRKNLSNPNVYVFGDFELLLGTIHPLRVSPAVKEITRVGGGGLPKLA